VLVPEGITWVDANSSAEQNGGHLVTITSQEENDFVFDLVNDDIYWGYQGNGWRVGAWIGAYQEGGSAEPDGGWNWITGEPFEYANWMEGQPNSNPNYAPENENVINFGFAKSRVDTWNDRRDYSQVYAYIIEFPQTFYVDDSATGNNDGSSWTDAYKCLQDALAIASSGNEIRVAQGTYKPDQQVVMSPRGPRLQSSGDRTAAFELISGVTIKGGYAGFGETDPETRDIEMYETILSGDLNGNDGTDFTNNSENSYHVVTSNGTDETAVLNGFTITAGNANGTNRESHGGGMYNESGSPTLTNCVFSTNWADNTGGGMNNSNNSNPTLNNCTFIGNSAGWGAGIYNYYHSSPMLTNCSFSANSGGGMYNSENSNSTLTNCTFDANTGGGMNNNSSSPTLHECTFIGNSDSGMNNWVSSSPVLTNCTFSGNSAGYGGGGLYNYKSSPTLTDCTFSENSAHRGGGMFNWHGCSPTLVNCTFSENSAHRGGGGVFNWHGCSPAFVNCTFSGNSAPNGNALGCDSDQQRPSNPQFSNCILWDSGDEIWNNDGSTITITYSDVQGGWPGTGNISANPLFVDSAIGDYHLLSDSPCINAGDPDYIAEPNETDLNGNPRIIYGRIDMGAYESDVAPTSNIYHVDADATGNSDGSSWTDAYKCLQDALAIALSGDEIWVAQGTYKPDQHSVILPRLGPQIQSSGDRTQTFQLIRGVAIKGGYAGFGEQEPDARNIEAYETILSGDLDGDDVDVSDPCDLVTEPTRIENSYHVVMGNGTDRTAMLDGFIITGGNANGDYPFNQGGGLYNELGSPTLTHCKFIDNTGTWCAGLYNYDRSNPTISHCEFRANASRSGSAIGNEEDCSPEIENCTFIQNHASTHGSGAVINKTRCSPIIIDCLFSQNHARGNGGALENIYNSHSTIISCDFRNNSTHNSGGAVFNAYKSRPTFVNCSFSGNEAYFGGGMYNSDSSPTVINCTYSANFATRTGGGISSIQNDLPVLVNCIFWGNSDESGTGVYSSQITGRAVINFSCVQDSLGSNPRPGEGNISADPLFADADKGDYRLKSQAGRWDPDSESWIIDETDSPCIDAGDPDTCIGFEPNPNGAVVNMGAYGGTAQASLSPSGVDCITTDHPDYDEWVAVGEPICWCYRRQCHGDADCKFQGKQKFWVSTDDLDILVAAWNKPFAEIDGKTVSGVPMICADFNHKAQGKKKYRVSTNDLDILIANWSKANAPAADCP
jgi:hypothetical protein